MTETQTQPWTARWRNIRRLVVLRTAPVTPGMRRITFGGPELAGLGQGPNLKLLLPPRPGAELHLPMPDAEGKPIWPADEALKPVIRTYTVARLDPVAGELDVDFVMHGDEGVASGWAARARPGEEIGLAGPGGRTVQPAARTILAGDQTALPAITGILAELPATAAGEAFIEVPGPAEEVALRHPPGVTITWLHHGAHGAGRTALLTEAVKALSIGAEEDVFVWVAAEAETCRTLRAHLTETCGIERRRTLVVAYWKLGLSETDFGRERHAEHPHSHPKAAAA